MTYNQPRSLCRRRAAALAISPAHRGENSIIRPSRGRFRLLQPALEQAVCRVLLTGRYAVDIGHAAADEDAALEEKLRAGALTASDLLAGYSRLL